MSECKQDKVMAFDALFTNHHIQKLKVLMPYLDRPMQKNMAIYIKFLELKYTMNFFRNFPGASMNPLPHEDSIDAAKLCSEMMPYCSSAERSSMENMKNMFQTFDSFQEMMEMVQMMQEMFPEGENPMNSLFGGMDMSQMSQMFDMFKMQGGSAADGNKES